MDDIRHRFRDVVRQMTTSHVLYNNKESAPTLGNVSETDAIDIAISNIDLLGHDAPKSRVTADIVANVSVIGNKLKSRMRRHR